MRCERCWWDAWDGGHFRGCGSQTERYHQLVDERVCTDEQQAGGYWDQSKRADTRLEAVDGLV